MMDRRDTAEEHASVTALVPRGQRLLASCFDAHHTIGGGLFAIGRSVETIDRVSSSGLCAADGLLFRCLWSADGSPAELVVYDATGVLRYHRLDDVSAPHDILAVDDQVLVVATTQNEIRAIAPDGRTAWRWRAPGEPDSWHLNSLALHDGHVVVCGFGQYLRRRGWDESGKPASGRVVRLDTGRPVLEGLRAPHNPWRVGDGWVVCDSAAGDLVEVPDAPDSPGRRIALPGWPRGLVVTDRYFFVGLSPHRHAASSVETAAVVAVDRTDWTIAGLTPLPAREAYALALVPTDLAAGARTGFATNETRVHEQGQRQLFDQVGAQPLRLWAIGDPLPEQACRATITAPDVVMTAGATDATAKGLLTVDCLVRNTGSEILTPAPPQPVRVVYTWHDEAGELVPGKVYRAALPKSLPPGASLRVPVRSRVPAEPGRYRLRITLAQDGGSSFDELDASSTLDLAVRVRAGLADSGHLAAFGLRPGKTAAAHATAVKVEDLVRSLTTRRDGTPHGLVLGLVENSGREAFAVALAEALDCSAQALRHIVDDCVPDPKDVLLTGAEAVALALRKTGTRLAFGRSAAATGPEAALHDALRRTGRLVGSAGVRASLLQAGGANLLRPGTAVAVIDENAGLPDALGALARLRREGTGLLVVTAGPSGTASDRTAPERAALSALARSWYRSDLPSDAADAPQAADVLLTALRDALDDVRTQPSGPVLLSMGGEAIQTAFIPLAPLLQTADALCPPATEAAGGQRHTAGPGAAQAAPPHDGLLRAIGAVAARSGTAGGAVVVDGGPAAAVDGAHGVRVVRGGAACAVGIALAEPSVDVWCALDATTFAESADSLVTAARQRVHVMLVVGAPPPHALSHAQRAAIESLGVRTRRVDLAGTPGERLGTTLVSALDQAARDLAGHEGPVLIDVVLPPGAPPGAEDRAEDDRAAGAATRGKQ